MHSYLFISCTINAMIKLRLNLQQHILCLLRPYEMSIDDIQEIRQARVSIVGGTGKAEHRQCPASGVLLDYFLPVEIL